MNNCRFLKVVMHVLQCKRCGSDTWEEGSAEFKMLI